MEIFKYVQKNNFLETKRYLQFGDVNVTDSKKRSLLHYAVFYNSFDCINLLLDNFINVNLQDYNGQTALFDAASKGKLGIVKLLIEKEADCNIQDNLGNVPLFYSIKINNCAIVDYLSKLTNLSITNYKKEDALFIAVKYKYFNFNTFILDDNYLKSNYKGENILHYACKYNNISIINKYIERKSVNLKNNDNETVFFYAVKYSTRDIVRKIIQFTPCIEITNKYFEKLIDVSKKNPYNVDDLLKNYKYSLEYIYYKNNNKVIYTYLSTNELPNNHTKQIINKKDNFSLSLLDYIIINNDKEMLKKITK